MPPHIRCRCCVFVFWTQIRKNRCDSYKKRRPCVLSIISIVAISVGLPVAVNNPVHASQVGFQQFCAIEHFFVEGSNTRRDHGHSSNNSKFLLTVVSERHFRIFANWLTFSIFFLAKIKEMCALSSQVDKPRASHQLNPDLVTVSLHCCVRRSSACTAQVHLTSTHETTDATC